MAAITPVKPRAQLASSSTIKPPPKSILRTASSKLGRRTRSDEDETDSLPSSPLKRRRVMFDETVEQVELEDVESRSLEETKKEVRKALEEHASGDEQGYDTLKDIFLNDQQRSSSGFGPQADDNDEIIRPEELLVYVVALTTCAPMIDKSCSGLVKAILQCAWLGRDEAFAKAYLQLLASLVSAHGSYLYTVLSMFVEKFRESRPQAVPGFPDVDRAIVQKRLHSGLAYFLQLFPAATSVIRKLISSEFPWSDESLQIHKAYITNLLKMIDYAGDIQADIMELITDRLVKLDVQMQLDLDDLDDETSAAVASQLRAAQTEALAGEEDLDESDVESVASEESDADDQDKRVEKTTKDIQKMDMILETLFQIYTPIFENPDSEKALDCFEQMLADLSNILLPTYKSRHTQFLLFHFSQRSATLTDMFVGTLFNIGFSNNTAMALRQNATAYLASFASRGKHVGPETVRSICDVILQHIELYRIRHENSSSDVRPDLRRFTPYYALFQGLLYIFCFRWRELIVSAPEIVDYNDILSYFGQDLTWIAGLKDILTQNIWSKFNPLKVCNPAITAEFARLARHLNLVFVYDKLESNRRVLLSSYASGGYSTSSENGPLRQSTLDTRDESFLQLDAYFPFDPYQLPVSSRWVMPDYNPWQPIPGLDGRDDEEDDSDDEAEVEDDDDMGEEDTATDDGDTDER